MAPDFAFDGAGRLTGFALGGGGAALSNENGMAASGVDTSAAELEGVVEFAGDDRTSCTALRRSE